MSLSQTPAALNPRPIPSFLALGLGVWFFSQFCFASNEAPCIAALEVKDERSSPSSRMTPPNFVLLSTDLLAGPPSDYKIDVVQYFRPITIPDLKAVVDPRGTPEDRLMRLLSQILGPVSQLRNDEQTKIFFPRQGVIQIGTSILNLHPDHNIHVRLENSKSNAPLLIATGKLTKDQNFELTIRFTPDPTDPFHFSYYPLELSLTHPTTTRSFLRLLDPRHTTIHGGFPPNRITIVERQYERYSTGLTEKVQNAQFINLDRTIQRSPTPQAVDRKQVEATLEYLFDGSYSLPENEEFDDQRVFLSLKQIIEHKVTYQEMGYLTRPILKKRVERFIERFARFSSDRALPSARVLPMTEFFRTYFFTDLNDYGYRNNGDWREVEAVDRIERTLHLLPMNLQKEIQKDIVDNWTNTPDEFVYSIAREYFVRVLQMPRDEFHKKYKLQPNPNDDTSSDSGK